MSNRGKRGPATCASKYEFEIEFDQDYQPTGKNRAKFVSWMGRKLRDDFRYDIESKNQPQEKWDTLWMEARVFFKFFVL
jgi:hypothetical protein